ncbi:SDR family NAD(P)-dependent oxidoreductase [Paenarthrobacter sp. NPDC091669]|uniref:SDR family NAD(P)-dependent oxidoreductase n=1 Tax=Paenarthrobacter sp. NPDC091669 TaxID=3364384 RepID=UPI0038154443
MSKLLEGKVAIVTGSGQGVGRGIALMLARHGARVVTNDLAPRRATKAVAASFRATALQGTELTLTQEEAERFEATAGDAESVAAQIIAEGGEAIHHYADVTNHEATGHLIQAAIREFGRLDILINNAAGMGFGPFLSLTPEDWRFQVEAKLTGTYNCMSHALPVMVKQESGRILNASSDAWTGIPMVSAYAAANAAVVALTKSAAKEVARYGVTINAYCPQAASPGHVSFNATFRSMLQQQDIHLKVNDERTRRSEKAHGPAENMTFLAYLASDEAAHISGSVFSVTGGGDIALYADPQHATSIVKDGEPWTIEEFRKSLHQELLTDYRPISERSEF